MIEYKLKWVKMCIYRFMYIKLNIQQIQDNIISMLGIVNLYSFN